VRKSIYGLREQGGGPTAVGGAVGPIAERELSEGREARGKVRSVSGGRHVRDEGAREKGRA
jgi:hypothetical protein